MILSFPGDAGVIRARQKKVLSGWSLVTHTHRKLPVTVDSHIVKRHGPLVTGERHVVSFVCLLLEKRTEDRLFSLRDPVTDRVSTASILISVEFTDAMVRR